MTFQVKNPKKNRSCFSRTFHMESPCYNTTATATALCKCWSLFILNKTSSKRAGRRCYTCKFNQRIFLKGNKILLSMAPILMQTALEPDFTEFFLIDIFFFMLMKEYVLVFRNGLPLHKLKKEDNLTSAS